jgi:hypothetical protein
MRKLFLIVSMILTFATIEAQTLPSRVEVFMPQILQERIVSTTSVNKLLKDASWGQKSPVKNKRYWVVYSDREENPAYSNPSNNSTIRCKLNFNQEVRIAQIKNGYALVY